MEQQCTVIELNAHAAIGSAQYPMWEPRTGREEVLRGDRCSR
ncbi:hypothetical protein [Nesterenkonia pannonica]|nr:hypothetical protein [Nesterenkonia pannonica]